jgi:hypothetical protein
MTPMTLDGLEIVPFTQLWEIVLQCLKSNDTTKERMHVFTS